jgi:hypothetical protein
MAWVPDDAYSTTVNILAEGWLDIISTTFPVSAHLGDTITGTVTFKNTGTAMDNFTVEVKRMDTGTFLLQGVYSNIAINVPFTPTCASFIMPSTPVQININTWHEQ